MAIKPDEILASVADAHGVTIEDIRGPSHRRHISRARQEAMYRLRNETRLGKRAFEWIALYLGRTDHTTAMHGVKQHEIRLKRARQGLST